MFPLLSLFDPDVMYFQLDRKLVSTTQTILLLFERQCVGFEELRFFAGT